MFSLFLIALLMAVLPLPVALVFVSRIRAFLIQFLFSLFSLVVICPISLAVPLLISLLFPVHLAVVIIILIPRRFFHLFLFASLSPVVIILSVTVIALFVSLLSFSSYILLLLSRVHTHMRGECSAVGLCC